VPLHRPAEVPGADIDPNVHKRLSEIMTGLDGKPITEETEGNET